MNLNPYLLLIILALLIAISFMSLVSYNKNYEIETRQLTIDSLIEISEIDRQIIKTLENGFELCREANKMRYCHETN